MLLCSDRVDSNTDLSIKLESVPMLPAIARRNETSVAQIAKDFGISDAVFGGGLPRLMVNETKFTET